MTTGNQVAIAADTQATSSHKATAFTFGAPESVLSAHEVFDYLECWFNGRWYEPPLSMDGLARSVKASVHLDSGLRFKRNQLSRTFIPHKLLSREAFDQYAQDYLALGNGYVEARRSMLGSPLALKPTLAKYMRVGKDGKYFQVQGWKNEH